MHMILFLVISAHWDASISKSLTIVSLISHAFVVRDDTHANTLLMHLFYCVGKHIISQVEYTDEEGFLCHLDVALKSMHIFSVWKEESIYIARLGPVEILVDLSNMLAKISQNRFVSIGAELRRCYIKEHIDSLLNWHTLISPRHLG